MPILTQIVHHLVAFFGIIHGHGRIGITTESLWQHSGSAQDKRYMKLCQFFLAVNQITTEKNNAPKPFFLYKLQRHLHFIIVIIDMLQNHGVGLFLDLFFQYLDHLAEERVINTFDQYCNCLGILTLQVSGTVVGYVVILFDHPHDRFLGLRIDVRVVIYGTGYRADADTADSGNVSDRDFLHGMQTFLSLQTYLPYSFVMLRIRPASSFVKSPFPILHIQLVPSVEGMLMRASDPKPR